MQLPSEGMAQEDVLCAAVFPCDPNTGELLDWARQGNCATSYQKICDSYALNALRSCMEDVGVLADTLSASEDRVGLLTAELTIAVKREARLRDKIRRLQNRPKKQRRSRQ